MQSKPVFPTNELVSEIRKKDITIENEGFANEVLMRFFILFVLIIALDLLE